MEILQENSEGLNASKLFFDKLISAWYPNRDVVYSTKHPSKINFTEVDNFDNDLSQLLRSVQIHKCTESYCLKKKSIHPKKAVVLNFQKKL